MLEGKAKSKVKALAFGVASIAIRHTAVHRDTEQIAATDNDVIAG